MENASQAMIESLQLFVRRFGLLNATCCDECCNQQVSLVQSQILLEVRHLHKPSIQQVAVALGMDITTFSRQIKTLETKRLVSRQVSPDDRRVSLLGLTDEGVQVLEEINRFLATRIEKTLSLMTPFEQGAVVSSLGLLNDSLVKSVSLHGEEKLYDAIKKQSNPSN